MAQIIAHFTNAGVPLVGASPVPTIRIRRTDTGALVVTDAAMTEMGDGNYRYTFAPVSTLEYSVRADGDPTAIGQTTATERYQFGAVSGITDARIETDIPNVQTRLPAALVGGRMDADVGNMQAGVITAAAIATDAIDADALAASAVAEIVAALNNLSAQDVRDAMKLAPTGGAPAAGSVDNHLDEIETDTSDIQPKIGTPAVDVSADLAAVQADTDDIQTRLPAALVSGRMDSDVAVIQAAALAALNTYLEVTASHGAGAWTSASAVDWTSTEKEQIRFRLAMDGTQTDPTTGTGTIEDILADTAAIEPLVTTNLNATVSSRAVAGDAMALTAGERTTLAGVVDTTLTASHGAGSWTSAASSSDWTAGEREQIRFRLAMDGTQTDPTTGTGTLEDILADTNEVQGKLPTNDIADETLQQAAHTQTQADIAALNNLAAVDILLVKQTYAYNKTNDALEGLIWVESLDGQIVTPTSVSVDVRDVDNALLFNMTDAAPDAAGFFKVTRAAPGFTTGYVFKAVASVTVPVVGVLTSGYGMFTIG